MSLVASRLSVMASPSWPVLPSTLMRSWRYFSYSAAVAKGRADQSNSTKSEEEVAVVNAPSKIESATGFE